MILIKLNRDEAKKITGTANTSKGLQAIFPVFVQNYYLLPGDGLGFYIMQLSDLNNHQEVKNRMIISVRDNVFPTFDTENLLDLNTIAYNDSLLDLEKQPLEVWSIDKLIENGAK
jgi:hypothetical protein